MKAFKNVITVVSCNASSLGAEERNIYIKRHTAALGEEKKCMQIIKVQINEMNAQNGETKYRSTHIPLTICRHITCAQKS